MRTSELTDTALDWAVAKALNLNEEDYVEIDNLYGPVWRGPEYSTDWAVAGPIIEREKIGLEWGPRLREQEWLAWTPAPEQTTGEAHAYGPTPLIAAMRCFVASRLGDEVNIPEEME